MHSPLEEIFQSSETKLLAKPYKNKSNQSSTKNIFASLHSTQPLPILKRVKGKPYHAIGPLQLRQQLIDFSEPKPVQEIKNETMLSNLNTTINRQTVLSKITRQQTNSVIREGKQMNRYREYQSYWDRQSEKLKRKSLRRPGQKTLLEENVKGIYVHENENKDDIINHHVVHYWEMSLRNNSKILKRHIKGHKFRQQELDELLQTDKGIKVVERSIPILPREKLAHTNKRQLSLKGKNKLFSETRSNTGTGMPWGQSKNQQQVYKVNYTGSNRWLSAQALSMT